MILATAARRAGSQTSADRLAAFIEDAVSRLEVAIYDFRLANAELAATVVGALTGAARRGVTVRLAYDAGKPTMGTAVMFARLAVDPAPPGTAQWVANDFGNSDVQIHAITAPSGRLMRSHSLSATGARRRRRLRCGLGRRIGPTTRGRCKRTTSSPSAHRRWRRRI